MGKKTAKNTITITVTTINEFTIRTVCGIVLQLNPYKRRLTSDVTFVTVLRHMCWTFSVRYYMYLSIHVFIYIFCLFCYLFIYIMLSN